MAENNSNINKINPFIQMPEVQLFPGEFIAPLNPYTNRGYIIAPYYFVTTNGRYFTIAAGRLEPKQLRITTNGYYEIGVITNCGQKHLLAHRGVMATFYPRFDMYDLQVDHILGDHFDNRLCNLRWVNSQQNNQFAWDKNINKSRTRSIDDETIVQIMDLAYQDYSDEEICEMIDIDTTPDTIRHIRTGEIIYGETLKRLGLKPIVKSVHTYLTQKDYDIIADLYESGLDPKNIAEKINISYHTVRHQIRKMYGNKEERKQKLGKKEPELKGPKKYNPIVTSSQKLIDNGVIIYPVNIYTSDLHVICPYYGVTKDGRIFSMARGNEWKEMTFRINDKGYATVGLSTDHGTKQFMVHRIVLSTFDPNNDMSDLEVNHKNGVKSDNRLENLEWVTHDENMRHAADNIIQFKSQKAPDEDIIKIVNLAWEGYSDKEISFIMDNKYTPNNVGIIRGGQKTYGPVLKELGLKPFLYQRRAYTEEEKKQVYEYINLRIGSIGMMDLYIEAGKKFDIPADSIRNIFREEKAKRK